MPVGQRIPSERLQLAVTKGLAQIKRAFDHPDACACANCTACST